jgi:hypothetical protein
MKLQISIVLMTGLSVIGAFQGLPLSNILIEPPEGS